MPSSESQILAGGSAEDRNSPAVDRSLAMRSGDGEATKVWASIHKSLGIYHHPKILHNLRGLEVGFLLVDDNAQLPTEVQDHLEVPEESLSGGRLD